MYGKAFKSMYTGSMCGAGLDVFAVWGWIIANKDEDGFVEINPDLLALVLCGSREVSIVSRVSKAINYLLEIDPKSRSKAEEGRRITHVEAYLYHVVNHQKYDDIRRDSDRKKQNREAQARFRAKNKVSKQPVSKSKQSKQGVSNSNDASAEISSSRPIDVDVDVKKIYKRNADADKTEDKPTALENHPEDYAELKAYRESIGRPITGAEAIRLWEHYCPPGTDDDTWRGANGKPIPDWRQKAAKWKTAAETATPANRTDAVCRCGLPADGTSVDDAGQRWGWCRVCQPGKWAKAQGGGAV